ncbi:MAG TPA: hypothetical protein VG712_02130 [Gemmatimonadales bacterium]|nr:hypothetical protein [Gemmatimonadales bacterium]
MAFQARLKPQFVSRYPGLNGVSWYDVEPLWAGLKERSTNLLGQRLARLKTGNGHVTVVAEHCDLREHRASSAVDAE